jgi:peptide-methionine (S)-S-oxide reductase
MRTEKLLLVVLVLGLGLGAAAYYRGTIMNPEPSTPNEPVEKPKQAAAAKPAETPAGMEKATFGAGCFWCVEAVFLTLKGVKSVVSGYSGGTVKDPTYEQVCTGRTGHAEVVQILFDPTVISYAELLDVFFQTHDPTTLNRQGHDVGTQYRSAIFYHSDEQKEIAQRTKKKLDASGNFSKPIVTEIVPSREFYLAEGYHQNYFEENPGNPYCRSVIPPKVDKVKKKFPDKLKDEVKK